MQTLLLELLDDAQNLFGEMLDDWTFYGIEIRDMSPCLLYYPDTGHVTIALSQKVIDDELQLIFQLSHEICHLLYPSKEYDTLIDNQTLVINEGISTYYSVIKTGQYFENGEEIAIENLKMYSKNYYSAYTAVKNLLQIDPNAIKTLREKTPRIDKLKESDFDSLPYNVPSELKRNLLLPFSQIPTL